MRIRQIRDEVWQASQAKASRAAEALARLPGLQHPGDLAALTDEEILGFDGVFIPGGHGPMVDFADNADIGRVLRLVHGTGKTRRRAVSRAGGAPVRPARPTGRGCSTATG